MKALNESLSVEEQYQHESNASLLQQEVLARQTAPAVNAGHHIVFNETLTISTLNETVTFDSTNREVGGPVAPSSGGSRPAPAVAPAPASTASPAAGGGSGEDSSEEPNSLRGDTTFTPPRQQASTPASTSAGGPEDFDEYEDYEDEEETEFDDHHQQGQRPPKYQDGLPERGDLFSARAPKSETEPVPQGQDSALGGAAGLQGQQRAVKGKPTKKGKGGKKNMLRNASRR